MSTQESSSFAVRYPDDLETAEAALDADEGAIEAVRGLLYDGRLRRWLMQRGANETQADDLLAAMLVDCLGGEKVRGGQHRLLGKFNGGCSLLSFLRRIALNRLISILRKGDPTVPLESPPNEEAEGRAPIETLSAPSRVASEDVVIDLLRDAIMKALAGVDQETLVLFRLFHSYRLKQQKLAAMWQVNYATLSRRLSNLRESLREAIMSQIELADPGLKLEWDDVVALCGESIDLFDYEI